MTTLASIDLIRSVPVFSGLGNPQIEEIARTCRIRSTHAGFTIVTAGEQAPALYIVLSGQVRVLDERRPGGPAEIDVLGRGAHLGESLLDGTPAPFTVTAVTDADLLMLSRDDLARLQATWPDIEASIHDYLQGRSTTAPDERPRGLSDPLEATPVRRALPRDEPNRPSFGPDGRIVWKRRATRLPRKRSAAVRQVRPIDAGPACVAAVCGVYGKRVGVTRVRALAHASRGGATVHTLRRAAEALGFETLAADATEHQLAANGAPVIVLLSHGRWVVVTRMSRRGVRIADPAAGVSARLPRAEFTSAWTGDALFLRPTDAFQEVEDDRPWRARIAPYLGPLRVLIGELLIASIVVQVLRLALPAFARFAIDEMIARRDDHWLAVSLQAMALVVAAFLVVSFARRRLLEFISRQIDARIVSDFYKHLLRLPVRFFESRAVGDVVSRFDETGKITEFLTAAGVGFLIDAVTALLYVALMAHYNRRLTAVALSFVALEILQLSYVAPRLSRGFRELFQESLDSEGLLVESLSGLRTIKLLAVEHYTRWTLESRLVRQVNTSLRMLKYGTLADVTSRLLGSLSAVAVLFFGGLLVLRRQMTVGELVAFTILTRGLTLPFATLASLWDRLQEMVNSVEQVNDVLDAPTEAADAPDDQRVELHRLQGNVRFDGVSFRYEEDGPDILHRVSFECYPGQHVAIVGRSGSGKSTLVRLLLGFYLPTEGRVSIDGFSVSDVWLPSLRRQVGAVLQESQLFRAPIRANITEGAANVPLGDVVAATRMVNAHAFITRLPEGYETMLDENGANLSGGQRQQVAIARALVRRRPMLIFDEATSNVDNESERYLHRSLEAQFRDSTVITITQRLQAVRYADLIVVLDRGMVVEQGLHAELMAREGLYYRLFMEQNP